MTEGTTIVIGGDTIKYATFKQANGLYCAMLLGGEFDNCHGQASTEDNVVRALKINYYHRKNNHEKE